MFMSLIRNRRSVREYTGQPVEKEKIDALVETALRAPSSRSVNPWEFIVVTDKSLLEKLSMAKPHGASFLKHASLGIVVCGDTGKSDVWIEDTAIASVFLHLAAGSLGLGSCWIQIRERMHGDGRSAGEYIADLLDIPSRLAVESIIAVGYPGQTKSPHARDTLQDEKVHYNRYGNQ